MKRVDLECVENLSSASFPPKGVEGALGARQVGEMP